MSDSNDFDNCEPKAVGNVRPFRRILAQVIAISIKNVHIFDLGLTLALPTIIVPALTGIPNEQNRNETLLITAEQASWIGSIGFIAQTFSGLLSGLLTDSLGRKRAMCLVNIPFIIGWLAIRQASGVQQIFIGFLSLGLAKGFMEAAVTTYHGEICEPSLRGTLIAYSNMFAGLAIFIVYFLNVWMPWRTVVLICIAVPIISTILLFFIPETPQWLLSKNRTKQAQSSLYWLRGWAKPSNQAIENEFHELQRHSQNAKSCNSCVKQNVQCTHPPPTLAEKLAEMKRKSTFHPFVIIVAIFFLVNFTGAPAMRSFVAQIFQAYDSPISPDKNVIILGIIENVANLSFMCLVRYTGRRRMFLAMICGIFMSSLVISCYGFIFLPSGYTSFNLQNQSFHLEIKSLSYIPTICMYSWIFFSYCGFFAMPWMLLSELFPFKSRGIASGIATALNNVLSFIAMKTYYNFEETLSLSGTSLLYCAISGIGLVSMYFVLPETENRTLEDIEKHFSDTSKKITDRNITRITNMA